MTNQLRFEHHTDPNTLATVMRPCSGQEDVLQGSADLRMCVVGCRADLLASRPQVIAFGFDVSAAFWLSRMSAVVAVIKALHARVPA